MLPNRTIAAGEDAAEIYSADERVVRVPRRNNRSERDRKRAQIQLQNRWATTPIDFQHIRGHVKEIAPGRDRTKLLRFGKNWVPASAGTSGGGEAYFISASRAA
jgi:hypothetical protein